MTDAAVRNAIGPGSTVALADGAGLPYEICRQLSERAREVGGVRLITGWLLEQPPGLEFAAFADVRTFMAGYGIARAIANGSATYVPVSVSQLPALLAGPWRPDVAVLSARETAGGLALGSEVSWIATAARHAATCLVELNPRLPDATRPGLLGGIELTVVGEFAREPTTLPGGAVDETSARIGALVASLVPDGAALQFGPGGIGAAVVGALDRPVAVDSGIVTDAVVDLAARGLLVGEPLGTYLVGSPRLYEWADGRPVLDRIEVTHDPSRLAARRLITVNTALQLDLAGQVNIEAIDGRQISGLGGHADYVLAGSRSVGGLGIVALPAQRRGRSTLVVRLADPVSTPRSAVDIVVTEHGHADLRGRSDAERAAVLRPLFPSFDP